VKKNFRKSQPEPKEKFPTLGAPPPPRPRPRRGICNRGYPRQPPKIRPNPQPAEPYSADYLPDRTPYGPGRTFPGGTFSCDRQPYLATLSTTALFLFGRTPQEQPLSVRPEPFGNSLPSFGEPSLTKALGPVSRPTEGRLQELVFSGIRFTRKTLSSTAAFLPTNAEPILAEGFQDEPSLWISRHSLRIQKTCGIKKQLNFPI